ncbi:GIY-YIG nuclease family protein [Ulvibacterium sp.]|uniref:GIY-YIG nuclease family protein n=1 Tax=Ulvibacterium sp. TaxID=2665914 RepID=UPI00345CBC9F
MSVNYFLYILQSEVKETFYIGSSDDLVRRLGYHNSKSKLFTYQRNQLLLDKIIVK